MKRQVSFIILTLIFILGITGCGQKTASKSLGKSETELVSSSVLSEISLSEKQGESRYSESDSFSDESVIDETTSTYSDNTLSSISDSSVTDTSGSVQTESTFSGNTPSKTQSVTSSHSNTTAHASQDTKKHTNETTTQTEHKTTYSITVPTTTAAQPSTTSAIPQTTTKHIEKNTINVTVSISCKAALNNPELNAGITLPSDGIILNNLSIKINEGDTVYDAFEKVCTDAGINFKFTGTAARKSIYISSIAGLSQMDCGKNSGWKYSVNGIEPSLGCSMYTLSDGDIIEWYYTTTL
ncbi:MAG: DUF4430 domain-containing protein [Lachnospiraceae bacterium]|nr:DUF4430 domain-containing protein [Lachnospiraceae bacterium]MDE6253040.1 DUF4430 domain-containing protein [Lachnospiraceae bacterium]